MHKIELMAPFDTRLIPGDVEFPGKFPYDGFVAIEAKLQGKMPKCIFQIAKMFLVKKLRQPGRPDSRGWRELNWSP